MAITKPTNLDGYPSIKLVSKNQQATITLNENYSYLYTSDITIEPNSEFYTEAIGQGVQTSLFLWNGNSLLLNSVDKLYFKNETSGTIVAQLIIKGYDPSNENGVSLPSGNYLVWESPISYSDGTTEGGTDDSGSGTDDGYDDSGSGTDDRN